MSMFTAIFTEKKDGRYQVVVTNGRDQSGAYFYDDYQDAVDCALEETHCWPFHDVLLYGMGSLIAVYRGGVKNAA